ncbi:virulence plasmid B protein [Paenibacillus cellulosilyticus]|uniref:Virulence plasmid B protein n=1 Tax=Paenibacillus cellulosilyticus TaxID=375489 RepID=A0A2V2YSK8_9BACL|nr:virulence plasmid B protein [Paenibacillus cellulosilyticus]
MLFEDIQAVQRDFEGAAYTVTVYRPRVDHHYERIEQWSGRTPGDTHWRVTCRNNITSLYGIAATSRISDPEDEGRIFRWLLAERFDAKGNRTVYEYDSEQPSCFAAVSETDRLTNANKYIRRICYGNVIPYLAEAK